jgi:hypothetical protein
VSRIEPEGWAAIAATVIAVISLIVQARDQRRQTRLTLLRLRLEGIQAVSELVTTTNHACSYLLSTPVRMIDNDLLDRIYRSSMQAQIINSLFGEEVSEVKDRIVGIESEVIYIEHHIRSHDPDATAWSERLLELQMQLIEQSRRFRQFVKPYVDRDRTVGLPWDERPSRWSPLDSQDILMRPSPPLDRPRTTAA